MLEEKVSVAEVALHELGCHDQVTNVHAFSTRLSNGVDFVEVSSLGNL